MSKITRRSPLALITCVAVAMMGLVLSPSTASAQKFEITPVAEKKVQQLPPGPLFWRIDNFPTLAQAQAAAGPTGLAAEVAGEVWLFTLGPKGGSSPGGSKVAETSGPQRIGVYKPIDEADRIDDWLYLPEVLYAFMLIMVVSADAGPYSLDALILGLIDKRGA
jgi:hypothetical protein